MSNKKEEILTRIDTLRPDVIAFTETLSKKTQSQQEKQNEGNIQIDNYETFINKRLFRGVALCIHKSLNPRECELLNKCEFDESV